MIPLFMILGLVIPFVMAVINIVDEKQRGILNAIRTVGLIESMYWLSWLLYYAVLILIQTLAVIAVGQGFGENIPFFYGTDISVQVR